MFAAALCKYRYTLIITDKGHYLSLDFFITVKPVLNCHSKIDKTKVLMINGSLMKVERIAECSPFGLFESGRFRLLLLYLDCTGAILTTAPQRPHLYTSGGPLKQLYLKK